MQFDNAQEILHRKMFDRTGCVIEHHTIAGNADAGAALTQAQRDLQVNWQLYRAAFCGEDHDRSDVDSVPAAQITERIDQTFDFVRDVIDDPQILETIPNGSELVFRDAMDQEHSIRLTAYLPKHPGARWGARASGVWRSPAYGRLWSASVISGLGSAISTLALPLLAALTLNVTSFQMGPLVDVESVPILLFGLATGVWVDRRAKRPVLTASALGGPLVFVAIWFSPVRTLSAPPDRLDEGDTRLR